MKCCCSKSPAAASAAILAASAGAFTVLLSGSNARGDAAFVITVTALALVTGVTVALLMARRGNAASRPPRDPDANPYRDEV